MSLIHSYHQNAIFCRSEKQLCICSKYSYKTVTVLPETAKKPSEIRFFGVHVSGYEERLYAWMKNEYTGYHVWCANEKRYLLNASW